MFVFFPFFRSSRGSRRSHHRRRQTPIGLGPVLLLLAVGLLILRPRFIPLLFFLLPLLFVWFFMAIAGSAFRHLTQASAEEYWSEHLEDESLLQDQREPPVLSRTPPEGMGRDERLLALWNQASAIAPDPALSRQAGSVLRQAHALADLFERFQELLRAKLRSDELSYQRFLSSGRQGYEMILAELQESVSRMEQLRSIGSSLRPAAGEEAIAPEAYEQIQREQLSKIDRILSGTQEAVAQLARVNFSIAEMRGISPRKAGDITLAIDQLKDLAQRAGKL